MAEVASHRPLDSIVELSDCDSRRLELSQRSECPPLLISDGVQWSEEEPRGTSRIDRWITMRQFEDVFAAGTE